MDRRLIFGAIGLVALVVLLLVMPSANRPQTEVRQLLVPAGEVRRLLASPKFNRRRTHNARSIIYDSPDGPIDISVLRFADNDPRSVERMRKMTKDLKNGTSPADPIAQQTGQTSGRIDLPKSLDDVTYLVLFRAAKRSGVTIRLSYGRD